DVALMFIPSESMYADIYESFDDIVQRARRARVMIVSPNMAVLAKSSPPGRSRARSTSTGGRRARWPTPASWC
ncbi:MAG TPA: DNA recombination protein RmuC, partial [Acidimicrobiales bacterium]|nr:DNA recombination protein RmuC [Acidimicrobiales bacterium]